MTSEIVPTALPQDYLVNLGLEASFLISQFQLGIKTESDAFCQLVDKENCLRGETPKGASDGR